MNENTIDYKKLQESFNKIVYVVSEFVEQVTEVFIKIWDSIKNILNRDISVRTKKYKKGKKYVHSYKRIKLFNYIRRYIV